MNLFMIIMKIIGKDQQQQSRRGDTKKRPKRHTTRKEICRRRSAVTDGSEAHQVSSRGDLPRKISGTERSGANQKSTRTEMLNTRKSSQYREIRQDVELTESD